MESKPVNLTRNWEAPAALACFLGLVLLEMAPLGRSAWHMVAVITLLPFGLAFAVSALRRVRGKSRFKILTFSIAGLWFLVISAFVARPTGVLQLYAFPLTAGLFIFGFISFVRVFVLWRHEGWRSIIPPCVCVLAMILAPAVGAAMQQALFQWSLPNFEAIIRRIESGSIPVSIDVYSVSEAEGRWAYSVWAQRTTNGTLTVEFLNGGGFPVKHCGYLYSSSGAVEMGSLFYSRWPKRHKVKPLWFRISD